MTRMNQKCYFRTASVEGFNKALLQITTRCNMHCKHCFVNSHTTGIDMTLGNFLENVIPFLVATNTSKVTLTGGEPLLNKDIFAFISTLLEHNIETAICTNGLNCNEQFMNKLSKIATPTSVHFNVSLDSYNETGYSNFRGVKNAFEVVKKNIELIASRGYLKGILCTPNSYSDVSEYVRIAEFAKQIGGKYALFNPIAKLGRGSLNQIDAGVSDSLLRELYNITSELISEKFDVTYVRFPLETGTPSSKCIANKLMYIYTNGDVVRCPYVSFLNQTLENDISIYTKSNFVGNINNGKLNRMEMITSSDISSLEC